MRTANAAGTTGAQIAEGCPAPERWREGQPQFVDRVSANDAPNGRVDASGWSFKENAEHAGRLPALIARKTGNKCKDCWHEAEEPVRLLTVDSLACCLGAAAIPLQLFSPYNVSRPGIPFVPRTGPVQ
jgi:hypothetical protein